MTYGSPFTLGTESQQSMPCVVQLTSFMIVQASGTHSNMILSGTGIGSICCEQGASFCDPRAVSCLQLKQTLATRVCQTEIVVWMRSEKQHEALRVLRMDKISLGHALL